MQSDRRWLLPILLAALAGCPGSAKIPARDHGPDASDLGLGPLGDQGTWIVTDAGAGEKKLTDGSKTDGGGNTTVGGPCPCKLPLLCVSGGCRKPCSQVICNAKTDCDPGQACANTAAKTPVCVPALAAGAACATLKFCESGTMCLTSDPATGAGICYTTCSGAGSACPTGSCRALAGSTCFFCY